ncbi:mucin TcMUCII, putative, partial [Trypanosoma cruzi]
MMTCRLLCALLVLALCCCPSVCVTANEVNGAPRTDHAVPKVPEVPEPG